MTGALDQIAVHRRDLRIDWSDDFTAALSPAEKHRADRYVREEDRRRFVAGRHLVRTVLAPACGCDPADVALTIDPNGRPHVTGAPSFNLSHAGDQVILAVAPSLEHGPAMDVGVDIEVVRDDIDLLTLGRHVLTEDERVAVRMASDHPTLFFRLWTAKEAILKMIGQGLRIDPRTLRIDARTNPYIIVRAPFMIGNCVEIPVPVKYVAALSWRYS